MCAKITFFVDICKFFVKIFHKIYKIYFNSDNDNRVYEVQNSDIIIKNNKNKNKRNNKDFCYKESLVLG